VGVGVNVAVGVGVGVCVAVGVAVGVNVAVGVAVGVAVAVGVGVGEAKPTSSLSVKASCWEVPLMAFRPSVHEVRCLVSNAEP
jgi:hypothetical protein